MQKVVGIFIASSKLRKKISQRDMIAELLITNSQQEWKIFMIFLSFFITQDKDCKISHKKGIPLVIRNWNFSPSPLSCANYGECAIATTCLPWNERENYEIIIAWIIIIFKCERHHSENQKKYHKNDIIKESEGNINLLVKKKEFVKNEEIIAFFTCNNIALWEQRRQCYHYLTQYSPSAY